ncbi:flagellin [Rhodocaloribacter litoris]|uniref:flagellin n=1 Tax=Rhodocaloribacter litoris TaxID=2558931 RepID=UPI00141F27EA|nr:flagellin [Rhodocaloribacter litoris]QXD16028.1 flagellin [Rhodocaloribacter litoris]
MGAFGDFSRINTNIQALDALRRFQLTNQNLGDRQLRLATGKRINRAEDDSAGFHIAKKLEARVRGQAQALANIGDAKSMLTVAEGSLGTIMEILQTMKEKVVQAANDTMGTDERTAIKNQLDALSAEIDEIVGDTTFNGTSLFSASAQTSFTFQVNAEQGDTFSVTLATLSASNLSVAIGDLTVASAASAGATLARIDTAITTIANVLANIGDSQKRLTFKQDALSTAITNYEAARSRIEDADFAKEQMEIVKLQILQQTGIASLAQANSGPQAILQLLQ